MPRVSLTVPPLRRGSGPLPAGRAPLHPALALLLTTALTGTALVAGICPAHAETATAPAPSPSPTEDVTPTTQPALVSCPGLIITSGRTETVHVTTTDPTVTLTAGRSNAGGEVSVSGLAVTYTAPLDHTDEDSIPVTGTNAEGVTGVCEIKVKVEAAPEPDPTEDPEPTPTEPPNSPAPTPAPTTSAPAPTEAPTSAPAPGPTSAPGAPAPSAPTAPGTTAEPDPSAPDGTSAEPQPAPAPGTAPGPGAPGAGPLGVPGGPLLSDTTGGAAPSLPTGRSPSTQDTGSPGLPTVPDTVISETPQDSAPQAGTDQDRASEHGDSARLWLLPTLLVAVLVVGLAGLWRRRPQV